MWVYGAQVLVDLVFWSRGRFRGDNLNTNSAIT